MKNFIVWLSLLLLLCCCAPAVAADTGPTGEEESGLLAQLDFSDVEQYVDQAEDLMKQAVGQGGIRDLWQQTLHGELDFDLKTLVQLAVAAFGREFAASGGLLVRLVVLAAACLLLTNLQQSFGNNGIATVSHGVVYLALISIALQSFSLASTAVLAAVDNMSGFLYALAPLLLTLLAATGGITSVGLFHPIFLGAVGIAVNVIKVVIVPLVYCSAALGVVSYITPRFNVDKMAKLCRDVGLGLLSIMMTIFLIILSITGVSGAAMDGIAIKAAKTASGTFIPIVGKALADTLDTVLGTALLLKNGIGIAGIIIVFCLCCFPALKTLVLVLTYRLAAALVQSLGDEALAKALSGLASALTMLFAVVAISGLFFFFVLAITIGVGNIGMMMR